MSVDGGAIQLSLEVADDRVAAARLTSTRPRQPGRIFHGHPCVDALSLLPVLFSLCGNAQMIAGLDAVEEAAGIMPAEPHRDARALLLAAETVLEHGQRILRDWPGLFGETPDMTAAKALRAALSGLRPLLYPHRNAARAGGGQLEPDKDLLTARLTQARAVLTPALSERRWPEMEISMVPLAADKGALAGLLAADEDGSFAAMPEIDGEPRFTHPAVRRFVPSPALREREGPAQREGEGGAGASTLRRSPHPPPSPACGRGSLSLADLAHARLDELRRCLDQAEALVPRLRPHSGSTTRPADGVGAGMVQAARGLLLHRVEIEAGRVLRWQILAPTEWNFHPRGPLAALVSQPADGIEQRARMLAALVDPCVEFHVETLGKPGPLVPGCADA